MDGIFIELENETDLRPKNAKTRFLDRFFDFLAKTPDFSPISQILAKNRPNFFVFGDMNLL